MLLIAGISFALFIFLPRHYDVPQFQPRASTQYWDLPTGSRIGYTLLPAKGQRKSCPVIFLQGGPGGFISNRNIETLQPLADDGYDVYLYDQIGSGQSSRLENIGDYTAERHKQDLEEIVKKIGAEKVVLIGQSWGAMLADLFVADNPTKVEKLILTGPGPILPVNPALENVQAPDSLHLKPPQFTNYQANLRTMNVRMRVVNYFATQWKIKLASNHEVDDYATLRENELNKAVVCDTLKALKGEAGNGYYAQIMTVKSFDQVKDPRPRLRKASFPVLVMKGQCDNQKWGYTNEYLQVFPNHKLVVVPDAGHSISIEQLEIYPATILDFLNED